MTLSWLTQRNLGTYAIGQSWLESASLDQPASPPLLIAYLAPTTAAVSLVAGQLPPGLTWTASPDWVTITGTIAADAADLIYDWTFRITEPGGASLDQTFEMQVSTRPVPTWITPGDLGTFPETQSFNLTPLVLQFSAESRARVTLLNGSLPPGLTWSRSGDTLVISGESTGISSQLAAEFTFRVANPNGRVADRTFSLVLIPAAALPDWTGQSADLGLIGAGRTGRFAVTAAGSSAVTYSLVEPVPPGMTIDPREGVISYQAPIVSTDTATNFTVRARTSAASSDLGCSITVLSIPHAPVWITPSTAIRLPQRRYLELRLQAFDPLDMPLIYLLVSSSPGFPFTLDGDGLLYGIAPPVAEDTTWSVVIKATTDPSLLGPTVSTDQTFEITVLDTNVDGVLEWNSAIVDLLGVRDGAMVNFDCGARSDRAPTVLHSVTGGQLPRGLMLDAITGALNGFLDYHPVAKDYWFDITATDGVDTLVRTMRFQVINSTDRAALRVDIPLGGDVKLLWQSQNHALVGAGGGLVNASVENNQFNSPSLLLVEGLGQALADPDSIIAGVQPWCQQLELSMGAVVVQPAGGDQLILRQVVDPQAGAAMQASRGGIAPDPLYPASLENLRQAFIDRCGFAAGGNGSGASALVFVDPEDGSIDQILLTDGSRGYTSEPAITISGGGTGADLQAVMGLRHITVIDPGSGWRVGDLIPMDLGAYARPATAVVADVTATGGLIRALITDQGAYHRVPNLKIFVAGPGGAVAGIELELEITGVEILAGGTGYGPDTGLSFAGEPGGTLPWQPEIPMLKVSTDAAEVILRQANRDPAVMALDGRVFTVDTAVITAEGLYWQGTTRFDDQVTTFDGDTTRYQETVDPRQTLIDRGRTTWDLDTTTLDQGDQALIDVQLAWGRTLIDQGMTAFDFYAVVFDPVRVTASTHSATRVQRILHLRQPQHTGHNVTNDAP